jgi:RNA polymerase-binding transcription factor DksA
VTDATREHLEEARVRTASQITTLLERFDEIVDAADGVATDDEHDPEGNTIAWERQQASALLADARTNLTDIEAALARVDDGTYGRCTDCGEPIAAARLEALPAASTCIGCASAQG